MPAYSPGRSRDNNQSFEVSRRHQRPVPAKQGAVLSAVPKICNSDALFCVQKARGFATAPNSAAEMAALYAHTYNITIPAATHFSKVLLESGLDEVFPDCVLLSSFTPTRRWEVQDVATYGRSVAEVLKQNSAFSEVCDEGQKEVCKPGLNPTNCFVGS